MNTVKIRVRKEIALCSKCKNPKKFLYLSDFSYGEKLILINGGMNYAFLNLFEDEIFDEFKEIVSCVFKMHNINVSKSKLIDAINCIFGISCDYIYDNLVDTSINEEKCSNCGSTEFESDLVEPEEFVDIELPNITHEIWKKLSSNKKKDKIEQELKKRRFI